MDNEKMIEKRAIETVRLATIIDGEVSVNSLNRAERVIDAGYGHIPTAIKEVQEQITAMLTEYGNEEHELFEQADGEWKSYHCGNLDAIGAISDMLYDLFDEILEEYTAHDD